jgi:hypothetical protein
MSESIHQAKSQLDRRKWFTRFRRAIVMTDDVSKVEATPTPFATNVAEAMAKK